jgi:hypothetical protein
MRGHMREFFRDLGTFVVALASHWWALVTGGVLASALGILGEMELIDVRPWMWGGVFLLAFFLAAFLAWREEYGKKRAVPFGCDVSAAQVASGGGGTSNGEHSRLLCVSLNVRFRNGSNQPLTMLGLRGALVNRATGESIEQRLRAEAVNEVGSGRALDRDTMVLVPPGEVSPRYWWRFFIEIKDGFQFTPDHVFEATMTAMNQRDTKLVVRGEWLAALMEGTVNVTPDSIEFS